MKISKITLKNILGLERFELDVTGPVTRISGGNGVGKSSILKGIHAALEGGNLAKLKNNDAPDDEPAEAVIVLDDDGRQIVIDRADNRLKISEQVGNTQEFKPIKPPQRYLEGILNKVASNPVRILTCSEKERIDLILEALDLEFNPARLWEMMSLNPSDFDAIPTGVHPLKEIALIRKTVFEHRTAVNVTEKSKTANMKEIRLTIPAELPTVERSDGKDEELAELRKVQTDRLYAADLRAREAKAEITQKFNAAVDAVELGAVQLKKKLQAEMAEQLEDYLAFEQGKLKYHREQVGIDTAEIEGNLYINRNEIRKMDSDIEALVSEIATIHEQANDAVRIEALHEQANRSESDAIELKAKSRHLTAALDALDAYKTTMVKDLPVPGLDISDGTKINNVKWKDLNTAQQITAAIRIACHRFKDGDIRPLFMDGIEALDTTNRALIAAETERAGAQAFFAAVTDGDLEVE